MHYPVPPSPQKREFQTGHTISKIFDICLYMYMYCNQY